MGAAILPLLGIASRTTSEKEGLSRDFLVTRAGFAIAVPIRTS
jgi:hypothetical protein